MNIINYSKSIPIRHTADVFVAGGGPAGIAAAVTAARLGKKVFLAEAAGCLGGLGTAGGVPAFMQFTDGVNFLAAGIGKEIHDKNAELGKVGTGIRAEVLKEIYEDMMAEAGVEFTYFTQLIDVIKDGAYIEAAILATKSGVYGVKAKIYIDGTGDDDLSVMAGAEYEKGDENGVMMPGTLCSVWAGIDWSKVGGSQAREFDRAFNDNIFKDKDRHLPGMWKIGDTVGGGNIGHAFGVDGTDEVSLTQAFTEQRKKLKEYEVYYKNYLEGFENMQLVSTGALMGIRETRRIVGDYVLNLEDFLSRAVFDDEIGRYCYPVDIHPSTTDEKAFNNFLDEYHKTMRYSKGESYGIPYRILTPKGLENVLVAGRCVSSDRYIQGSIRVMPGCYITGQAAGAAASLAIDGNTHTRGFAVGALQAKLKDNNGKKSWAKRPVRNSEASVGKKDAKN